jgi:hypothetical protein
MAPRAPAVRFLVLIALLSTMAIRFMPETHHTDLAEPAAATLPVDEPRPAPAAR